MLKQALVGRKPSFFCLRVNMRVYPLSRLLITSSIMWHDMDLMIA